MKQCRQNRRPSEGDPAGLEIRIQVFDKRKAAGHEREQTQFRTDFNIALCKQNGAGSEHHKSGSDAGIDVNPVTVELSRAAARAHNPYELFALQMFA